MEAEQQSQPASPDAQRAFCAEYGEQALALHEAHARIADLMRLRALAEQLMAEHGPGKCAPVEPEPDGEGG